jgi:hypothetical protein
LFGGTDVGMAFARSVSLVSWLACPIIVAGYYFKQWSWPYALLAMVFILLPAEPYMLLDIVHVTPDSTMAFLFVCTMVVAQVIFEKQIVSKWELLLVGGLAALCFLTKQQGIIAIASVVIYAIINRNKLQDLFYLSLGFFVPFLLAVIYFEIINSESFLQDTLFGLDRVMVVTPGLAGDRLLNFLTHNLAFTLCVIVSFILISRRSIKLSIWHVSFALNFILLLKILGNAGGGTNYFLTFWITIVVISVGIVVKFNRDATLFTLFHRTMKVNWSAPRLSRVLLTCLFINIIFGSVSILQQLNATVLPNKHLETVMQEYSSYVGELMKSNPDARVLTNRNIGALVEHKVNVTNEGSTMFQYAWAHPELFNQNKILTSISDKKYDFIFTGLQPYPANVRAVIDISYKLAITKELGVMQGNIGLVKIYVPKDNH